MQRTAFDLDSNLLGWNDYLYNSFGKIEKINQFGSDSTPSGNTVYTYNEKQQLVKETHGVPGINFQYEYNETGQVTSQIQFDFDLRQIQQLVFEYDNNKRLIKIKLYNNKYQFPDKPVKIFIYEYEYY